LINERFLRKSMKAVQTCFERRHVMDSGTCQYQWEKRNL